MTRGRAVAALLLVWFLALGMLSRPHAQPLLTIRHAHPLDLELTERELG